MRDESQAAADARQRPVVWSSFQIWALGLLVLINTFNFLDRAILGILQQPIKVDLNLSDLQLGVISGPAFAVLYAVTAIPVARWAERGSRVSILSGAIALWGLLTAAGGLAHSFLQLALSRVGVGIGESACAPTCHSLISDYFPARQRGTAMAIMTTSIPIGGAFGALIGGIVAHGWGWRAAFLVAGLPGLALALLSRLTLKEPARGAHDGITPVSPGRFGADFRVLVRTPGFLHVLLAQVLVGAGVYGSNLFMPAFVLRRYGLSLSEVGALTAAAVGVAGVAGVLSGGYFADRFGGSKGRSYMVVPALGCFANGALLIVAVMQSSWQMTFLLVTVAHVCNGLKDGPIYAAIQNMAPPQMRATAAAMTLLCVNAIGGGLGPLAVGAISDTLTASSFPSKFGAYNHACMGHAAARTADVVQACGAASAHGLRYGIIIVCCLLFWGAIHLWIAGGRINLLLDRRVAAPSASASA